MLREQEAERRVRKLVEWIAEHGERSEGRPGVRRVTVRQLQRSNSRKYPANEDAEGALNDLVACGLGCWVEGDAPPGGGHRPRWFEMTLPTHDTSDTRSDGDETASDTRSDTRSGGDAA
jgi:hypothetical protein